MQRKTTQDKRTGQIGPFRASQKERDKLAALANATGLGIAEIIRQGVNRIADENGRAHVFRA